MLSNTRHDGVLLLCVAIVPKNVIPDIYERFFSFQHTPYAIPPKQPPNVL